MALVKEPTVVEVQEEDPRIEEMQRAINFANTAHAGQVRKYSNLPYIVHPMQVLALVAEWGVEDMVVRKAAVCHDIREERPDIDFEKMKKILGLSAAKVCEELTFIPDSDSNLPDHEQKKLYIKTFLEKSLESLIVKCADRICNTYDFLTQDPVYAPKYWPRARRCSRPCSRAPSRSRRTNASALPSSPA